MASSNIVITQDGITGQPALSRDDIVTGLPVTLSNANDNGVRSWRWVLVSRPRFSTAALTNVVNAQPQFTPDVVGSYLIRLTVNDGFEGEIDEILVAVRNPPVTIGAETFQTRYIASQEATEANWTVDFGPGPEPNTTGWWADFDLWCRLIQGIATSGVPSTSPWDAVLADGNRTGTTPPTVDVTIPLVWHYSGTGDSRTAIAGVDVANGVFTASYDLPIFSRFNLTPGVGADLPITTFVVPEPGGGDTEADVDILVKARVDAGGISQLSFSYRGRLRTDGAFPFVSTYGVAGNVFRFTITQVGGGLVLNYVDTVAATSVEVHGKISVAAVAK